MSATFLNDTFTEASGTPALTSHTGETGASWSLWAGSGGGTAIVDSTLDRLWTTSGNVIAYASGTPADEDYYTEAVMIYKSSAATQVGPAVRLDTAAANGYAVIWNQSTTKWELYRFASGGTKVGQSAATRTLNANQSYTVRLHAWGTGATVYLEVFVDGVSEITYSDTNASRITAINKGGVYVQGSMSSTTGFHVDSVTGVAGPFPITPGVLTAGTHTDAVVNVSWTVASGGTAPLTAQLQRSAHGAGSWSNISGATSSPATDSTVSAGTDYDYRVAYTDSNASPATEYSNTVNITVNPTATSLTFAHTDLWSNGNSNITSPYSFMAILKLSTDASDLEITGRSSIVASFPLDAHLGVRVDGGTPTIYTVTADATDTLFNLHLGTAGTTRTVEIIAGTVTKPSGTVLGTWLKSLKWCGGSACNITAPSTTNRVLIYGDSISVGAFATNPETEGWAALLRTTYSRNVMVEGWGYRALKDDCTDATARAAFTTLLSGYSPAKIIIAIGTNDFGLDKWTAATFGSALADLLSRLHTAMPTVPIYCITPFTRLDFANEATANGLGDHLSDYRTAISTAASGKAYVTVIDGTAISLTGKYADNIHPNTAGHATIVAAIEAQLPPTEPTIGTATPSGTQVTVTWTDNSSDETGFEIDYDLHSNNFSSPTTVTAAANATSKVITAGTLAASTQYDFRVRSTNSNGDSANSATASCTTGTDDSTAPTATATIIASSAVGVEVDLTVTDNVAVDFTCFQLATDPIMITGPGGYNWPAFYYSDDSGDANQPTIHAIFVQTEHKPTVPGTYTVSVVASKFADTAIPPNYVAAGPIGTFTVGRKNNQMGNNSTAIKVAGM